MSRQGRGNHLASDSRAVSSHVGLLRHSLGGNGTGRSYSYSRPRPRLPFGRCLRLEPLEARCVLSIVGPVLDGAEADSSLLQVTSMLPQPGAELTESPSQIALTFNQAVGPNSLLPQHLLLEGSGGDGTFGNGNETTIRPTGLLFVSDTEVVVDLTGVTLPSDQYRLSVDANPRFTSLMFDGVNDYVSTPLNIDQSSSSPGVTFEAWVYPSSPGNGRRHVMGTDNSGFDWSLLRQDGEWYVFTGEASRPTGFAVVEGRWQHVAAVFEPGRGVTFYMDGQESFIPYIDYDTSDANLAIGRNPSYSEFFAGAIDEVRIWNGVRTAEEIRANMHEPLAGSESGFLAYWKFDAGTGQSLIDGSPNGRHAVRGATTATSGDDPAWRTEPNWPASVDGYMLDGEFNGSFPSGDGTAGGAFVAEFEVLDVTPPWILKHSPAGNVVGPVDHVVVTFSEPIDPSSWDAGDVQLLNASGMPVAVSGVTQLDGDRFRISFPAQTALGSYSITVLPVATDMSGNPLDQNRNGVAGEASDAYGSGFKIVAANQYYFESFGGELGPEWSFPSLGGEGEVRFTTDFSVDAGGRGLLFHSANPSGDSVKDLNEAVLTLNLSAMSGAMLTFHYLKMGVASTAIADVHVTDSGPSRPAGALGDGVSISNNGTTWYRIKSVFGDEISRAGDGLWNLEEYDLPAEVARINSAFGAGLTLNDVVHIKFSQYGARSFAREGWVLDNVRVSGVPEYVHTSLDPNVLHRLNVPGESAGDFYYRVALIGDVTPQTSIYVSVHGSLGSSRKYSHTWYNAALRADSGIESLVLVSPEFVYGGRYQNDSTPSYAALSWSNVSDAQADVALLGILDHLDALGLGDASEFYLSGHSAGGQFTERFTWAHPDRITAAMVSAPGSRLFPDEHERYPLGSSPNYARPASDGVDIAANLPDVLDTRLIYRVGEFDREVINANFQQYPMAAQQGLTRIHRTVNMYEAMNDIAPSAGRLSATLDYQVVVMEGIGHSGTSSPAEAATFYRMMLAPKVESDVFVYPRLVAQPTADASRAALPAHVEQWQPGETLYLELWVTTTSEAGLGSATTNLFIDSEVLTPINITHGALFPNNRTGQIGTGTSWVHGVGGATSQSGVGSGTFAMLARVQVSVKNVQSLSQLVALPQLGTWTLADGTEGAARLMPLPYAERAVLGGTDLFGQIFNDEDSDGTLDANEAGLAGWTVRLVDQGGSDLAVTRSLNAADFWSVASLSKASRDVTLSTVGGGSLGMSVMALSRDVGGVTRLVFGTQGNNGYISYWNENTGVELRADFASPVWQVSARAWGDATGFRQARIRAYDADGNLIAEKLSGNLTGSATETITVSAAGPQIAYVIVTGVNSSIRLDQLTFLSTVRTTTDAFGNFEFRDVAPGTYRIAVDDVPEGWRWTRPLADGDPVQISSEARGFVSGGAIVENFPPVAMDDSYFCIPDEMKVVYSYESVLLNDVDPNGDTLTAHRLSDPAHGTIVSFGSTGWFQYMPNPGFRGLDSFTYRAYDGMAYSEPATVWLQVGSAVQVPGDANDDGVVDAEDAKILASNWGKSGMTWADGDFNDDGAVNAIDAAILAANFDATRSAGEATPTEQQVPVEPVTVGAAPFVGPLPVGDTVSARQPIQPVQRLNGLGSQQRERFVAQQRAYALRSPDLRSPDLRSSELGSPEEWFIETASESSPAALDAALAEEYGPTIEPAGLLNRQAAWSSMVARRQANRRDVEELGRAELAIDLLMAGR
ncbi:MAG: cadherin-like domain-containing protein [Pirellulaceae bacterium]|nr:cadherin-like domain-containing protein [Pirellulaceae bacterium]